MTLGELLLAVVCGLIYIGLSRLFNRTYRDQVKLLRDEMKELAEDAEKKRDEAQRLWRECHKIQGRTEAQTDINYRFISALLTHAGVSGQEIRDMWKKARDQVKKDGSDENYT